MEGRPSTTIMGVLWTQRARRMCTVVQPHMCRVTECVLHCSMCAASADDCVAVAGRRCFAQAAGYHEGMTALMFAAEAGSLEICQLLVQNNADVNAQA